MINTNNMIHEPQVVETVDSITKLVAPSWPLNDMVAVNPFHHFANKPFEETATLFSALTNIQLFMPLSFYKHRVKAGKILREDIEGALKKSASDVDVDQLLFDLHANSEETENTSSLLSVSDLAESAFQLNVNTILTDGISNWASAYFNEFNLPGKQENLFRAWKEYALIDKSPAVMGIKSFSDTIAKIPEDENEAIAFILEKLNIPKELLGMYVFRLTYKLTGWPAYISGLDWNNNLYGGQVNQLKQYFAIILSWEFGIYEAFKKEGIDLLWERQLKSRDGVQHFVQTNDQLFMKRMLQTAVDFANQRELKSKFQVKPEVQAATAPDVQAVFCIDVRSEVYRRQLEVVDPLVQTIGFAGFFGIPLKYKPLGINQPVNQCPVLLPAGPVVTETTPTVGSKQLKRKRFYRSEIRKILKGFRKSPVSSFGYVSPLGLFYLPKLISDSFGITRPVDKIEQSGYRNYLTERQVDISAIPFEDQLNMCASALKGMGLTRDFASIVLLTGHGSSGVNNPHAAGLACGACGGHAGDINALTIVTMLNNGKIRTGLVQYQIFIPSETLFLAGLHDTATDQVTILNADAVKTIHSDKFEKLKRAIEEASNNCRLERSLRLVPEGETTGYDLFKRSRDWAQTRPEWGLAGCNSFIAADRQKTKHLDLNSTAFLHDYQFEKDGDLKILEGIMTAPMVVASWINLQYYASTVDNHHFGAGNKTLHNVTSGIGVMEGAGGDLRIGLPLQSLKIGDQLEHIPQKLVVIIDAPIDSINKILAKHQYVRDLFDNRWIYLLNLNKDGQIAHRYCSDLQWESYQ